MYHRSFFYFIYIHIKGLIYFQATKAFSSARNSLYLGLGEPVPREHSMTERSNPISCSSLYARGSPNADEDTDTPSPYVQRCASRKKRPHTGAFYYIPYSIFFKNESGFGEKSSSSSSFSPSDVKL